MNVFRRLLLLISIFLAGFPALFAQTETMELLPLPERDDMTEILSLIEELNSYCPIQLDDVTAISNASLCDSMMVYTVEYAGTEDGFLQLIPLKDDLHDLFLSTDAENADPLAINLATHDVGIKYHYKRLNGSEEFEVIITSQELRDAINVSLKDGILPFGETVELLPLPERDDLTEIIAEIKGLDSLCPMQVDNVTTFSGATFYDRMMVLLYEYAAQKEAFLLFMSAEDGMHDMYLGSFIENLDASTISLATHDVGIKIRCKRMYGTEEFDIFITAQELRDAINAYLKNGAIPYQGSDNVLQSIVDMMKLVLPMEINPDTYLVDVDYRDKVLSFCCETNDVNGFWINNSPEKEQVFKEMLLNSMLQHDLASALVEEEASFRMVFRSKQVADSVEIRIENADIRSFVQRIEDHSEALRFVEEVNKNLPYSENGIEFERCELSENQDVIRFICNVDEMVVARLEGYEENIKATMLTTLFRQFPRTEWSRIYALGISLEYVYVARMTKRTVTIPITKEEIHELLFSN